MTSSTPNECIREIGTGNGIIIHDIKMWLKRSEPSGSAISKYSLEHQKSKLHKMLIGVAACAIKETAQHILTSKQSSNIR